MDYSKIQRSDKRKCACIVVPHPDDFEILVAHTAIALFSANYQVYEILMSGGEYGIANRFKSTGQRIKGIKLYKIRLKENESAKTIYGTFADGMLHVISLRMDYIDGFIPFSKRAVNRLKNLLEFLHPTFVVGPDPYFSTDLHPDHLATARTTFFAVKEMQQSLRPRFLFFYQSFKTNFGIPTQSWMMIANANNAHRSQMVPIQIKIFIFLLKRLIFPYRRNRAILRRFDVRQFDLSMNWTEHLSSFRDYILYAITNIAKKMGFAASASLYFPTPQELGLNTEPNDFHTQNII